MKLSPSFLVTALTILSKAHADFYIYRHDLHATSGESKGTPLFGWIFFSLTDRQDSDRLKGANPPPVPECPNSDVRCGFSVDVSPEPAKGSDRDGCVMEPWPHNEALTRFEIKLPNGAGHWSIHKDGERYRLWDVSKGPMWTLVGECSLIYRQKDFGGFDNSNTPKCQDNNPSRQKGTLYDVDGTAQWFCSSDSVWFPKPL